MVVRPIAKLSEEARCIIWPQTLCCDAVPQRYIQGACAPVDRPGHGRAEGQRTAAKLGERQAAAAAHEEALRSSRQYADRTVVLSKKQQRGAGRHVLADKVRRNQRERLQSPGHEPTQRYDYSTSAPLPDPRPGATSGVVGPLSRCPGTAADRRPAPVGLLAASDRRRAGSASVHDQTRAGSAPTW